MGGRARGIVVDVRAKKDARVLPPSIDFVAWSRVVRLGRLCGWRLACERILPRWKTNLLQEEEADQSTQSRKNGANEAGQRVGICGASVSALLTNEYVASCSHLWRKALLPKISG